MKAEIISIGDEILIGQIVNTNAAYIGEKLLEIGIRTNRVVSVGDGEDIIIQSFNRAFEENDIIIVTGGLGPTHDDITKKVLLKYFNAKMVMNNEVLDHVKDMLGRRNIALSKINEEQALVPDCCKVLFNNLGTAPGMHFTKDNKEMFVMPGVPFEMKYIIDTHIIPYLKSKVRESIKVKTLLTTGLPESMLFNRLGDISEYIKKAEIAFLPSALGVRIRIMVHDINEQAAADEVERIEKMIREKINAYIYGEGNEQLEEIIGKLLNKLKFKISTAESCSGGMLANKFTNISGSSDYFDRGVISYSNDSKTQILSVPAELIKEKGAVSQEVAMAMASGIRINSGSDIGISTTGIAGPLGGSEEKPVGSVWIGYSDKNKTYAKFYNFGNNRLAFKERVAQTALDILRKELQNTNEK